MSNRGSDKGRGGFTDLTQFLQEWNFILSYFQQYYSSTHNKPSEYKGLLELVPPFFIFLNLVKWACTFSSFMFWRDIEVYLYT